VVVGLKPRAITRYFREARTQEPRLVGPVRRFGGGINAELNGMWVHSGRKVVGTSRKGKPPKGESQERCRCETKPARDSRE